MKEMGPDMMNKTKARDTKRLNQSIVSWCFEKYWDIEKMCMVAQQLGCKSVELVEPKHWPMLKKYGP